MPELETEKIINGFRQDFMEDLHSFMEEEEVKVLGIDIEKEGFKIETKEQANYFLKKLSEAEMEIEEVQAAAKKEIEEVKQRVDSWLTTQLNPLQRSVQYYTTLLQNFADDMDLKNAKKKTISLPYGKLSYKNQQDKYEYNDEKAAIAFLETDDSLKKKYVNYKPALNKTDLKKQAVVKNGKLFIDGKEVPGIEVIPQDQAFIVKAD